MVTALRRQMRIRPTVTYLDSSSIPRRERTDYQETISFILRKMCRPVTARPEFREELFKSLKALDEREQV